jgi:anti-sigma regulatory factor (Ser/Thr protein kinase)
MASDQQLRHSRLELASRPTAARWARLHAKELLKGWQVPEAVAGDALLIVSELVTNAYRHAGDASGEAVETCNLLMWLTTGWLTVAVQDWNAKLPVPRSAHSDAEQGRGLLLVEQLSVKWGYSIPSPHPGKIVWARLAIPVPQGAPGQQRSLEVNAHPTGADVGVAMTA